MDKNLAYSLSTRPCLFISPHLDDAVLSCGALIAHLASKTPVTVATVFTESRDRPTSLSTWNFLRLTGYHSASTLFADRRHEDKAVVASLGAQAFHLGFTDGLYRLKPTSGFVYPFYSWAIKRGKVSSADEPLIPQIADKIKARISEQTVIFAPAAIGHHMDHLLVRRVCERYFPKAIYWSDFPYNLHHKIFTFDKTGYSTLQWSENLERKINAIEATSTQVGALFHGREIPRRPEYFFYPLEI